MRRVLKLSSLPHLQPVYRDGEHTMLRCSGDVRRDPVSKEVKELQRAVIHEGQAHARHLPRSEKGMRGNRRGREGTNFRVIKF